MSGDAVYNRTLNGSWSMYASNQYNWTPWTGPYPCFQGVKISAPLTRISLLKKPDQDFASYSTAWEKRFSRLVRPDFKFDPVVNENLEVVGHIGWVEGRSILIRTPDKRVVSVQGGDLNSILKNKWKALVDKSDDLSPDLIADGWYAFGIGEQAFRVVTGIDGRVLCMQQQKSIGGLQESMISPIDLVMIPYMAISLTASIAGGAARMAVRIAPRLGSAALSAGTEIAAANGLADEFVWSLARRDAVEAGDALASKTASSFSREITTVFPRQTVPQFAARVTEIQGYGSMSGKAMYSKLEAKLAARRELRELMTAAKLSGTAKRDKIMSAIRMWQADTGHIVEYWEEGTVVKINGGNKRNLIYFTGNKLIVDRIVLNDVDDFLLEISHELVANALGWSHEIDKIFLGWVGESRRFTSQYLLEFAIAEGSLDRAMLGLIDEAADISPP